MSRPAAADYLDKHATEVSIILAELAESAGAVARSWTRAVSVSRNDPEGALEHLADASVRLTTSVRTEVADSLRVIRRAMDLLDLELPDPPDAGVA